MAWLPADPVFQVIRVDHVGAGSLVVGFGPHFCLVGFGFIGEKVPGSLTSQKWSSNASYPLYYHKHLSMLAKRFMINE